MLSFFLLAFTSFFTLINPLGVMPVFLTMTHGLSPRQRNAMATKAVIIATIALVAFAFGGKFLFQFFGISVNGLRIVGGIIFFYVGQDMLQARLVKTKVDEKDLKEYISDISITPLAIPMICGPGAITNAIVLMNDSVTVMHRLILIATILLMGLLTLLVLLQSGYITKLLGETGNKVLMRLMGLIVMVIAVEFFISGARPIIRDILKL